MGKALGAEVVGIPRQFPILPSFFHLRSDRLGFYFEEANGCQMANPVALLFVVPDEWAGTAPPLVREGPAKSGLTGQHGDGIGPMDPSRIGS